MHFEPNAPKTGRAFDTPGCDPSTLPPVRIQALTCSSFLTCSLILLRLTLLPRRIPLWTSSFSSAASIILSYSEHSTDHPHGSHTPLPLCHLWQPLFNSDPRQSAPLPSGREAPSLLQRARAHRPSTRGTHTMPPAQARDVQTQTFDCIDANPFNVLTHL